MVKNQEYWDIDRVSDLEGWTILAIENFKRGVLRLHLRSTTKEKQVYFRVVYCEQKIIDEFKASLEPIE